MRTARCMLGRIKVVEPSSTPSRSVLLNSKRRQMRKAEKGRALSTNAVQNPQELVTIVDQNNHITGSATRAEMRALNLIHRCSYVVIYNSDRDKIFVQKRVSFKETYPSHFDPAPGMIAGVETRFTYAPFCSHQYSKLTLNAQVELWVQMNHMKRTQSVK